MSDHAKRLREMAHLYEGRSRNALLAGAESLEREEKVRTYATGLAKAIHAKHYKNREWQVLPDTLGVLTQIDNMVAGLVRLLQMPTKDKP